MLVTLTIIRYKKRYIPFAVLAMALHHIPFWFNATTSFYKLLGCGKNGTFDKHPDWQQWGILAAHTAGNVNTHLTIKELYGNFIAGWLQLFNCEVCTFYLEPMEGHGKWDGKECFGNLSRQNPFEGPVAVLTRATIRFSQLSSFWKNVGSVANQMNGADGFVTSIGIGEMPLIKQATFSIWQSKEQMKSFAYNMKEHAEVIRKTRKENWYSEDMFVRFKPLKINGTINGKNPLNEIL
ncbi:MAG TPA: spheroidene monooxygenase [Ferruginibacter sp.]|nr:spheroidene monooxygenase [Ferruginibacter sp.]HPH92287.1 spheroidene monooxygenase [Ferruginibacter sp.]